MSKDGSRSETQTANERSKALSGIFTNLATGLIAAVAARIYVNGDLDRVSIVWTLGVIALIVIALKMLVLLERED